MKNKTKSDLIDPARPDRGRLDVIRDLPICKVRTLTEDECRRIKAHSNPYRADVREFKKAVWGRLCQIWGIRP